MTENNGEPRSDLLLEIQIGLVKRVLLFTLGTLGVFFCLILWFLMLPSSIVPSPLLVFRSYGWGAVIFAGFISIMILGAYQIAPMYMRYKNLKERDREMFL
jgi:hypothetical protein